MIQQINLYQEKTKKSQTDSTLIRYIIALATVLILITGYSLYAYIDLNNTKIELKTAKEQLRTTETDIEILKIKYPPQKINPLLIQEIARLQKIQDSLSSVVQQLNDNQWDQNVGFSQYFSALARQIIADVWLRNITIDAKNQTLTLVGSSYYAKKIPLLIQALRYESIFQGKNFAKLIVTEDETIDEQVNFTVSTTNEKLAEDGHD